MSGKTIISVPCWVGEPWRVERYKRWLAYNYAIKDKLGFDEIWMYDNASDLSALKQLDATIYDIDTGELLHETPGSILKIYRYTTFIARGGVWEIPYWWRWMRSTQELLSTNKDIEKVLFIDSDFYVLSQKMAHFVKSLSTGWTATQCTKYGFPETAMMFICKDSFHLLINMDIPSNTAHNNKSAETLFPIPNVIKTFVGDRYGEEGLAQTAQMDYYGQWVPGGPDLVFDLKEKP